MSFINSVTEAFSTRRLPGESRSSGALDQWTGIALVAAGILYLWFDALGGVLRLIFPAAGLTLLTYLPAGIAILALLGTLIARLGDAATSIPILAVVGFIVIEVLIALVLGRPFAAILFAGYIWLPGLVMIALCQRHMQDRVINALVPIFFIATLGVLLNIFVKYPWTDATYEVLGQTRDAGREWSAYGQQRLGGFSRASFVAAGHILLGYCALEYRLKSFAWRAFWWAAGLVAVYYTTSKSPFLAMALLPGTYFIIGRIRQTDGVSRQRAAGALIAFWTLLIFAGPFVAMTYGHELYPNGVGMGRAYSSLADRVLNTWPKAIAAIDWSDPVSWIVGRGLGGIGAPQAFFEPPGNPGDNLAIYLFTEFGLLAFVLGALVVRGGLRAARASARGRRDFALIVGMLGIASAANVVEGVTTMIIFGLALARPRSRREQSKDEPA